MNFYQWSGEHPFLFLLACVTVVLVSVIAGETISSSVKGLRR